MEMLGFVAGLFSTVSFIPQVYKTYKTKSAKDVSMPMFIIYSISVFLWIIYGIWVSSTPIWTCNIIVFVLALIQVFLKIKYDRQKRT
jgi:MtN3 and saliva related transmembrane protein